MKRTYVKNQLKNVSGFTLLEVLVVIVLLSILAGILYPYISGIESNARVTTMKENYHQIKTISGAAHALRSLNGESDLGHYSLTIDDKSIGTNGKPEFNYAYLTAAGMMDVFGALIKDNDGIGKLAGTTSAAIYIGDAPASVSDVQCGVIYSQATQGGDAPSLTLKTNCSDV